MKVVILTSQTHFFSPITMTKMCTNEEIIAFYIKNHDIKQKCFLPLFNTYLCNSYLPDANYNR